MDRKIKSIRQRSMNIYSELVRKGEYDAASFLLRALINGVKTIKIGYSNTEWTLGNALCGNNSVYTRIQ